MLNMEISNCCHDNDKILTSIDHLENNLQSLFNIRDVAKWNKENEERYLQQLKISNNHLDAKFKKLEESQKPLPDVQFDETFIKNLSSQEIPTDVLTILSLGPKFAVAPKELPILDLASDVELIIKNQVPDDEKRRVRGEVLYSITKFSKQNRKLNRIEKYLQKAAHTARKFLKDNPNIMVSNSDKGGVVIISDKEDYRSKMRALLDDVNTFEPLSNDPTQTVKNKVNKILDNLYKAHTISNKIKKSLKTWNTVPPRVFGQI